LLTLGDYSLVRALVWPISGWTALHVAVRHGLTKAVTHLLNHRLDVDARTKSSESAGHIALKYRHVGIVDVLLNYGMNIETRDDKGETMLQSLPSKVAFRTACLLFRFCPQTVS
jgi:hypothetical protein